MYNQSNSFSFSFFCLFFFFNSCIQLPVIHIYIIVLFFYNFLLIHGSLLPGFMVVCAFSFFFCLVDLKKKNKSKMQETLYHTVHSQHVCLYVLYVCTFEYLNDCNGLFVCSCSLVSSFVFVFVFVFSCFSCFIWIEGLKLRG